MVVPLTQFNKNGEMSVSDSASNVYEPNLFILYHYLKKQLKQNSQLDMPYAVEYRFNLLVSRSYERLGCPLLALYILTRYYMKPPSLEENKEKEESKLDRAEDLFADEPAKPSYATDLFSDEPAKPSYADDLFADEPAKSFYATDLFADEPPSKPSYATDLFADEEPTSSNDLFANDDDDDDDDDDDIFASKPASSSQGLFDDADNGDDDDETSTETPDEKVYDGLDAYKALLVIRILQVSQIWNDQNHQLTYSK
jgi:hypothetical protein